MTMGDDGQSEALQAPCILPVLQLRRLDAASHAELSRSICVLNEQVGMTNGSGMPLDLTTVSFPIPLLLSLVPKGRMSLNVEFCFKASEHKLVGVNEIIFLCPKGLYFFCTVEKIATITIDYSIYYL